MKRTARRITGLSTAALCVCSIVGAQTQSGSASKPPATKIVKASRMLDVRSGRYVDSAAVLIDGDRIKEVGTASSIASHAPAGTQVIDLGSATLLPGLADCHTHIMARIPDGPDGYILNLATKSEAFRALEGAADAKLTLEAGFTTIRDVESEGSGYADVDLRNAINQGLVPGPRMQVSTRGIAAVGQYEPFGVSWDLKDFPTGAQMVSGVDEARRAVREQIGHGADWIKVYADWEDPTLTVEEISVIVQEAHKHQVKVAAHATSPEGIHNALVAGVDSIEHGHRADAASLQMMKDKGVYLIPTLSVVDAHFAAMKPKVSAAQWQRMQKFLDSMQSVLQQAMAMGVKIANGSDAGSADSHGNNAQELVAMTHRGMPPIDAIRAATISAADLLGWQDKIGAIEPGKFADLIAVDGDPVANIEVLKEVKFVMKGGEVVKNSLPAK